MGRFRFSDDRERWMRLRNGLWFWPVAWLCWALLSGCVQDGSPASQSGKSVAGGWVKESGGSCVNTLSIRQGGRAAWLFRVLGNF